MIGSDISSRARLTLKDSATPYRWPDADLLIYINDGIKEIIRRRPDSLYTSTSVVTTVPADLSALSGTVALTDFFRQPLVDYVCYRAFLQDAEDPTNASRASNHLQLFTSGT